MPEFSRDGLVFHYQESGTGLPFVFQHGLGGDVNQPLGLLDLLPGFRLIAFDFRGHGLTRPLGDPEKIGIASFADDLAALLDHLGLPRAIVGGISLGAAVALNFGLRHPDRALGLVLSRPAWLDKPFPENTHTYPRIARLIRDHGALEGCKRFQTSAEYQVVLEQSPDAAKSLVGQFESPRAEDAVVRLERIPNDAPCRHRDEWAAIRVPTLVLGNCQDPIHPFEYAKALAQAIPQAQFAELTPKSIRVESHVADVCKAVRAFLDAHFRTGSPTPC
jgi:pimeloyl-ACP methyl ester carboxylesterase